MIASGLTAAAFPWSNSLASWFTVRPLNGMAAALSIIPLESLINRQSAPEHRAQNFGYYAFCFALGMALGTLVGLRLYGTWPRISFLLGGVGPLAGALVVLAWRPLFSTAAEQEQDHGVLGIRRNFLGFGSSWSQGFLEAGMVALLPIYLLTVGLSQEDTGWLMSGLMIGVILAQVPVAWLADRLGRTAVLAGCNLIALLGIGCLLVSNGQAWLALWLFAVGACSGAFYPLGLALLGERMPPAGLARANAWYLAINCAGSLTGPFLAGAAMDHFGPRALFLAGGSAVLLVLIIWLVLEVYRVRTGYSETGDGEAEKQESWRPAA
jgi:MFS family permease